MTSLAEFLRSLDRAATPGPWGEEVFEQFIATIPTEQASKDAETMVALRNLLPALADVVDTLEHVDTCLKSGGVLDEDEVDAVLRNLSETIAREQSR